MLELQTDEYMSQMNASIRDKGKMLKWIHGKNILDAGCGSGIFTEKLRYDGYNAVGMDMSQLSFENMKSRGLENSFILGDVTKIPMYFLQGELDTIVFSSILHEVYSYKGFNIHQIDHALRLALSTLSSKGRIIIRDGVHGDIDKEVLIRFKDKNDILFLTEFDNRFKGIFTYSQNDKMTFQMSEACASEFLYTYTWGWESFDREVQEHYTVGSPDFYKEVLVSKGMKCIHSEIYLQEGYVNHLKDKIDYMDLDHNHIPLPCSNMLLIFEKK